MVVDLAVVVVVVVACLRLLFVIGVATALGVHVVVASLSSFLASLLPFLPSFLLPCFLAFFLPSFLFSVLLTFFPSSFVPASLLPSFLLPCFLAFFFPSFLPAFRSLEDKEGNKGFLRETE